MTIADAISAVDTRKPNAYSQYEKIQWLNQIDWMIQKEIVNAHEDGDDSFVGYYADTPIDTELLAEQPYDSLYISWLESRIDYVNGEIAKYNNSNAVFATEFAAYSNYYNRTHIPTGEKLRYF